MKRTDPTMLPVSRYDLEAIIKLVTMNFKLGVGAVQDVSLIIVVEGFQSLHKLTQGHWQGCGTLPHGKIVILI